MITLSEMRLLALGAIFVCILLATHKVRAQSELDHTRYIEKIISKLNNRYDCDLPSYDEVDELQKAFTELEEQNGAEKFEMLSDDMRIVRRTLLDQWASFQKRMSSKVVIRAAKRRSFMCKVEEYQLYKFGDSVCTRFKDSQNKVTDKIFEKNPIVRYIKHLETGEVIERTTEQVTERPQLTELTPVEPTKTVGEEAGEIQQATDKQEEAAESARNVDYSGTDSGFSTNSDVESNNEPIEYKNPADGLKPGDHYLDEDGTPKIFLGLITITNQDNGPDSGRNFSIKLDQNLNYDPLEAIPVPKSTDQGEEEPKDEEFDEETTPQTQDTPIEATTTTEAPEPESADSHVEAINSPPVGQENEQISDTTTETPATTTTEEPLYNELGAAFVDEEEDDLDLTRVVRLPKKDWEFDEVFGYFKWPDEIQSEQEDHSLRLDHSIRHQWNDFMLDPDAFDQYIDELKKKNAPKNRITNGSVARKKKQAFFDALDNEAKRDKMFGHTFDDVPDRRPYEALRMPPVHRDRWVKMLNNNVCKLGYNRDEIKRKTKGGYKSVKGWFKGFKGDEEKLEFP